VLTIGSYYVNPTHDQAVASHDLMEKFPEYTAPNIWPSDNVLPGFREAFENLARLIVRVGSLLAKVLSYLIELEPLLTQTQGMRRVWY